MRCSSCTAPGTRLIVTALGRQFPTRAKLARRVRRGVLAAVMAGLAGTVLAQAPGDFFKDKSLNLYIGYSVGGAYDLYARLLARHLPKHLPHSPAIVPRNMEGAGSLRLANWLYGAAPRDGTAMGTIGRGAPFDKLLARPGIDFEATEFSWIGSANDEVSICVAWHTSGVSHFTDLMQKELIVGAAGAGSDDDQFPRVINGVLGTKMRVVSGYPGGNDVVLAMERGEVNGRCGWSWSSVKSTHPTWLAAGKINILTQLGLSRHPDLPDIPLVTDFAKTDEQRRILRLILVRQALGRPFLGPPGIPPERLAVLRQGFNETMKDPRFLADAEKLKLEVRPLSGEQAEVVVRQIYAETSPTIAQRAAALLP
jgi:tripartite-type tricarboxylate transporter receptor subunit TctC